MNTLDTFVLIVIIVSLVLQILMWYDTLKTVRETRKSVESVLTNFQLYPDRRMQEYSEVDVKATAALYENLNFKKANPPVESLVFETRSEAEDVLDHMKKLISQYGYVTLNDLYDLTGQTGNFNSEMFGWRNLDDAKLVWIGNGYKMELPKRVLLDYSIERGSANRGSEKPAESMTNFRSEIDGAIEKLSEVTLDVQPSKTNVETLDEKGEA